MARETRGLGKGLSALLGDAAVSADQLRKPVGYLNKEIAGGTRFGDSSDVMRIPIEMISPNPYQPRKTFDQDALDELAASIRTLGLIQPITVRRVAENRYQIISGERRFKACCLNGMTMVPSFVRDANDQGMLEMSLVENIQRENLDPIETALSYMRLMEECSLTQEQMADRLGKSRPSVSNTVRLLKLPVKIQHDLKVGLISTGHAKAFLSLPDASLQEKACDRVVAQGLNVRQTEELVKALLKSDDGKPAVVADNPVSIPDNWTSLAGRIESLLPGGVSVRRNASGSGSITVRFKSDEEFEKFLSLFGNES